MKINYVSDLHLETRFDLSVQSLVGDKVHKSDILVLAGDILTVRLIENKRDELENIFSFFRKNYKYMLAVMGNHEYYHSEIREAQKIVSEFYQKFDVKLLLDESIVIEDKLIYGGTMWTSYNDGRNISAILAAIDCMNDYRVIRIGDSILMPNDTILMYNNFISNLPNDCDLVISHHSPCHKSMSEKYSNARIDSLTSDLNHSFYTDVNDMKGAKNWIHGHMHNNSDYVYNETRIVANPGGYGNENPNFKWNSIIEI